MWAVLLLAFTANAATLASAPSTQPRPKLGKAASQPTASSSFSSSSFSSSTLPSFSSSPASSANNIAAAYATLYDQTKFRAYNMAISPSNLVLMNKDPKQELKVPCTVTTDYQSPQAQTYSSPNLACGYKGSVGALRICFDAYGKFSPDDCRKPSYKIDADYYNTQADDRISGVHRLMFHGAPADWSLVGERLAFNLLASWNIIAPTATHATLYENGQSLGVFVFVSAIDDIFTQKWFSNDYNQGKGALYKEAWFNPVHMANLSATFKFGKNENAFMNQIESAMLATPMTQQAASQFFDTYFDVNSLVDVTAANTVLGDTDDWRQRHNMYWYIREDANGKKAVLIPWDYDRLNDAGADTRGALKGRPWWDPSTEQYCDSRLRTAAERGAIKGGSDPMQVAYWTDIFLNTPPDVEIPVSCDRIAQLMAIGLGSRIRQRTRDFAATINRASMQASVQTWTNQIAAAVARDPDGPQAADMVSEQQSLIDHIVTSAQKAVSDANDGDRGVSSTPAISSTGTTFVPKAQATGGTVGADAYKYQVGQVISSTFTPAPGAAAAAFLATGVVSGFVPKTSPTSSAQTVSSFVPKTTTAQSPTPFTSTSQQSSTFSQQSSTSFPSFSQSSSSFSQSSSSFPQSSFSQSSFPSFSQSSSSFPSFSQSSSSFPSQSSSSSFPSQSSSSFPSFAQSSSSFPSFSQSSFSQPSQSSFSQSSFTPQFSSFSGAASSPSFGATSSFSSWQG